MYWLQRKYENRNDTTERTQEWNELSIKDGRSLKTACRSIIADENTCGTWLHYKEWSKQLKIGDS